MKVLTAIQDENQNYFDILEKFLVSTHFYPVFIVVFTKSYDTLLTSPSVDN